MPAVEKYLFLPMSLEGRSPEHYIVDPRDLEKVRTESLPREIVDRIKEFQEDANDCVYLKFAPSAAKDHRHQDGGRLERQDRISRTNPR
ncbi:hypothetical protein Trydic_g20879 [Trypoxylus dichotomus]